MNSRIYVTADWIEPLSDLADDVCLYVPIGYEISLNFESDGICVVLTKCGHHVELPDSADKSIAEQINDALLVANGFDFNGIV